jgi:acetyl-CoA C-acetyltransferase
MTSAIIYTVQGFERSEDGVQLMTKIVILSAVRTPIGKFNGTLKDTPATALGAIAVKEAIARARLEPKDMQECIMGNVLQASLGQNPARQAAVGARIPYEVGAFTVNKVCGSGMKAVMLASNSIKAGEHEVVVAGGMENMDSAPYLLKEARFGYRLGDNKVIDHMVQDGLWDSFTNQHMGMTAEIVAERFGVRREEADLLAFESHQKAAKAAAEGQYRNEIAPVVLRSKKGDTTFDRDEGIRTDTSIEALAKLRPAFKENGVVTAGNSSQLSDGAAALVVSSEAYAKRAGVEPLAEIVGYHTGGTRPEWIMEAPIPTTRQLLEKAHIRMSDLRLFEHNEAFATASVAVMKELQVPREIFNVNGGAVALGHPIGCSGARVLTTLIHALRARGGGLGLGTLCLGGGNAVSMIVRA